MHYTNIYPVFEKMKAKEHEIFPEGKQRHLCKEDYRNIRNLSTLNQKINDDIEAMILSTDRKKDMYVSIDEKNGMRLTKEKTREEIYFVLVVFNGFKYLFVKSQDYYILVNFADVNGGICYRLDKEEWEIIPREGKSGRTIMDLNEPHVKYVVNVYTAFCGFCDIHLKVPSTELLYKYNTEFHETIGLILEQIVLNENTVDLNCSCTVNGISVYVRLIKIFNIIIIVDWYKKL